MNFEIEHDACGIGTVVQIDGKQSYDVLDKALHIVEKLEHRAGKDASGKVGDGVGILLQISDDFFRKTLKKDNIKNLRQRYEKIPVSLCANVICMCIKC